MNSLERIKALCDAKGITISQLEKDLGYGNGSLAKSKSIKADRLFEIAEYFDTTMDYLYDGKENSYDNYYIDPEVQEIAEEMATRSELKVLFKASRKMTKEQIEAINQMINTMK